MSFLMHKTVIVIEMPEQCTACNKVSKPSSGNHKSQIITNDGSVCVQASLTTQLASGN